MAGTMRPRVTVLIDQIKALTDERDLVLVAKAATHQLATTNARLVRSGQDEIGARVEIVDLDRNLDGLTGIIVEARPPRRGYTHIVIIELDPDSAEALAQRSDKWKQTLSARGHRIPVSRSNLSLIGRHQPD